MRWKRYVDAVVFVSLHFTNVSHIQQNPTDRDRFVADADVYLRLMEQALKQGAQYVPQEIRRVRRLLAGKVSDNKRTELQQRLNVLNGFDIFDDAANAVRDDGDL